MPRPFARYLGPAAALLLGSIASRAAAQTSEAGAVSGRIVDARSGEGLEGATVSLLNTAVTVASGSDGGYRLTVRAGQYTASVVRVGYARQTVPVRVQSGQTTALEVRLSPSSVKLSDVVVTAEKEEQRVQEIPYAISAISSEQIRNAKLEKPSDLTGFVPNTVSNSAGTAGVNLVSIRGINSFTGGSYENAIATYVDGVYLFDVAALDAHLGDIERIEVLRGPQGTLYGRGASGGVINIVTKAPTNQRRGHGSAEFGNFGQQRYKATLSGPLVRDQLFGSVDGLYFRRGGIYTNTVTNADFDQENTWGVNTRLRYLPSSRWSLGLNARIERAKVRGSFALAASDSLAFAHPYQVASDLENIDRRHVYGYSFDVRHFGSKVEVVSTTAYQRTFRGTGDDGLDVDFTGLPLLSSTYGASSGFTKPGYHNNAWTQELRLSSRRSAGSRFGWTAGVFGFTQRSPIYQEVFVDQSLSPFQASLRAQTYGRLESDGFAIFGQGVVAVAPRLDLTLGIRYDRQKNTGASVSDVIVVGGPTFEGTEVTAEQESDAVNPKASLSFRANERIMVYGTYSRGYRAGGINVSGVTSLPSGYQPEFTDNFEIGIKGSAADGRVRANLTGFLIKTKDQQVSSYDFSTFASAILNSGRATSKGLELELSALPVRGFLVDWNLGLTDAKYHELNLSVDPNVPFDLSGNKLTLTPAITSATAAQVDFPVGNGSQFVLRGEWRYLGKHYFDLENKIEQKGYSLFTARAAVTTRWLDVAVWGRNLFDTRYISYGTPFGGTRVFLGEPRQVGVTLSTRIW